MAGNFLSTCSSCGVASLLLAGNLCAAPLEFGVFSRDFSRRSNFRFFFSEVTKSLWISFSTLDSFKVGENVSFLQKISFVYLGNYAMADRLTVSKFSRVNFVVVSASFVTNLVLVILYDIAFILVHFLED